MIVARDARTSLKKFDAENFGARQQVICAWRQAIKQKQVADEW